MFKKELIKSVLLFLVFILQGCGKSESIITHYIEPQCITSQSHCEIATSNGVFNILFNIDPVITENEFDISLKFDGGSKIKKVSAYIEGKDMFMGKIPLFFESISENSLYLSQAMLGSCNEELMNWVINFTVSIEKQDKTIIDETFPIEFVSQRLN